MRRPWVAAALAVASSICARASAQQPPVAPEPAPPAAQPPAAQPEPPPAPTYPSYPSYPNSEPPAYPQTYPQNEPPTVPAPNPAGYIAPPRDAPEPGRGCCLWSVRYDPFELLFRRATIAAEVAWGKLPFSFELTPTYIFNSPSDSLSEQGFDLGANIAWYPGGHALRGLWVKAHAEYENFRATLTRTLTGNAGDPPAGTPDPSVCDADSATGQCSRRVSSFILGLMVGSSYVFGDNGGFAISGGIGIGAALAPAQTLTVLPGPTGDSAPASTYSFYDSAARIRLLGTLGLGVSF